MSQFLTGIKSEKQFLVFLIFLSTGCGGTMLGNPKNPDETTVKPKAATLPVIKPRLPAKVLEKPSGKLNLIESDLRLKSETCTTLLNCMAKRTDEVIKTINMSFEVLNQHIQPETGQTSFTDTQGQVISGLVSVSDGRQNYKYDGTFCKNNQVFLHIKWNESQSKVHFIFDQNVWSGTPGSFQGITEVIFDKGKSEKLSVHSQGKTDIRSANEVSGDYLTEVFNTETNYTGQTVVSGFNDWDQNEDEFEQTEYDSYLMSEFNEHGDGNLLQYYKEENDYCSEDQDQFTFNPGFGDEFNIISPAADSYTLNLNMDDDGDEDIHESWEEIPEDYWEPGTFDDPDFETDDFDEYLADDLESQTDSISWCSASRIGESDELEESLSQEVENSLKKTKIINNQKVNKIRFSPNISCP